MSKEAKARIKINKLLEEAGWRFFDRIAKVWGEEKETKVYRENEKVALAAEAEIKLL